MRGCLEARQPQLAVVHRPHPRARDADASAAEHDRALGVAGSNRLPFGVVATRRPAQRDPVLLHHRPQHQLAGLDAHAEERTLGVLQARELPSLHFNTFWDCAGETGEGMRVKSPGQGRSGPAGTESCERPGDVAFEA